VHATSLDVYDRGIISREPSVKKDETPVYKIEVTLWRVPNENGKLRLSSPRHYRVAGRIADRALQYKILILRVRPKK
jgi:hypothetical protein